MTPLSSSSDERQSSGPSAKVSQAEVRLVSVLRVERVSPSFVRIVFGPHAPGDPVPFPRLGGDQWFRLFLPRPDCRGEDMPLPWGPADGWYQRWLSIPEDERGVVRNYTLRALRGEGADWELDVDFVLHRGESGRLEGAAASWADSARPGDRAGILGQGTIVVPPGRGERLLAVCDETGLPGLEALLDELDGLGADVDVVAEVPHSADARPLPAARSVHWVPRSDGEAWPRHVATTSDDDHLGSTPHADASHGCGSAPVPFTIEPTDTVYAVGSNVLALGVRKLARAAGVPDERIAFCSYWRATRSRGK